MRVLVTRPNDEAQRTAARLAARGHDALVCPLLTIVPTGDPAPEGDFTAILVTSARAVDALARLPGRTGPVFAVGAQTGERLRQAGFVDLRIGSGDAAGLAEAVAAALPAGARVLHAAGRHRKPEPGLSLRARGFDVAVWEVYEARAATVLPNELAEALATGRIDAALHYSRRSTALLVELAEKAGLLAALRDLSHAGLSGDAAAPLAAAGAKVMLAAEPAEEALLAALDRTRPQKAD
jgi:uroporphyrinogen-III synthase